MRKVKAYVWRPIVLKCHHNNARVKHRPKQKKGKK